MITERRYMQWNYSRIPYLVKLELLSNATTIDSTLSYIRNNQQQEQHKKLDSTSNDNNSDNQLTNAGYIQTVF